MLNAIANQFPEAWESNNNIPLLKAFRERISQYEPIAEYLKSDRVRPWEGYYYFIFYY